MGWLERFYFSNWYMRRVAKRTLDWASELTDADEWKKTLVSRSKVQVKLERSKGVPTFTIHVRVREGDMYVWRYRKYSILDSMDDKTPFQEGDTALTNRHYVHFIRRGKYRFNAGYSGR